jgi:hypothetical protein
MGKYLKSIDLIRLDEAQMLNRLPISKKVIFAVNHFDSLWQYYFSRRISKDDGYS